MPALRPLLPAALLPLLAPVLQTVLLALSLLTAANPAAAEARENCFHSASVKYRIDPWLLVAIARVESAMRPDAHRKNDDGSEDIGLMQINSVWLPALAQHGIGRADLFNHCTSIQVAAWILANQLYRHGKSWQTVGRYHSTIPVKNAAWVARVVSRLRNEHPDFAQFNRALSPAPPPAPVTTLTSASNSNSPPPQVVAMSPF